MFTALIALVSLSAPAQAQLDYRSIAPVLQDGREVGMVLVGLPPGPCLSTEIFLLTADYRRPGLDARGLEIGPASALKPQAIEGIVAAFRAENPEGNVITVEIQEYSAECR
jgi:hypothetical protein